MPLSKRHVQATLKVKGNAFVDPKEVPNLTQRYTESYVRRRLLALEDAVVLLLQSQLTEAYDDIRGYMMDTAPKRADAPKRAWKRDLDVYLQRRFMALGEQLAGTAYDYAVLMYLLSYYGKLWQLDSLLVNGVGALKRATMQQASLTVLTRVMMAEAVKAPADAPVDADPVMYKAFGTEWRAMYGDQLTEMMGKVRQTVSSGLMNRRGVPDISKQVARTMGVDRSVKKNRNKITTITRSAMIDSMNQASLDMYAGYAHLIGEVQWVTSYDRRVCPICERLAGRRWKLGDPTAPKPVQSTHLNCRCTTIPIPRTDNAMVGNELNPEQGFTNWMHNSGLGDLASELNLAGATSRRLWQGRQPAPPRRAPGRVSLPLFPGAGKAEPATDPDAPESTEGWEQIGDQLGSNPGGLYQDAAGNKYYIKEIDEDRVRSEVAANELYGMAGVQAMQTKLVRHKGKLAFASKWVDDSESLDADIKNAPPAAKVQVARGLAADMWLANWDFATSGNLRMAGGSVYRIESGGALEYRAQGQLKGKDFTNTVKEVESYQDANYPAGRVLKEVLKTRAGRVAFARGLDDLASMKPKHIREAIRRAYPEGNEALEKKMIARRRYLLKNRDSILKSIGYTAADEKERLKKPKTPKPAPANQRPPQPIPGVAPEPSPTVGQLLINTPKGMKATTASKIHDDPNGAYAKKMAKNPKYAKWIKQLQQATGAEVDAPAPAPAPAPAKPTPKPKPPPEPAPSVDELLAKPPPGITPGMAQSVYNFPQGANAKAIAAKGDDHADWVNKMQKAKAAAAAAPAFKPATAPAPAPETVSPAELAKTPPLGIPVNVATQMATDSSVVDRWMQDPSLDSDAREWLRKMKQATAAQAGEDRAARLRRRAAPGTPIADMTISELLAETETTEGRALPKDIATKAPRKSQLPQWLTGDYSGYAGKSGEEFRAGIKRIEQQLGSPVSVLHKTLQQKVFPGDKVQRQKLGTVAYEEESKRWDGWRAGLSKQEIKDMRYYSTTNGAKLINKALRDPDSVTPAQLKRAQRIEGVLRKAIDKAPAPPPPHVVYRYVDDKAGLQNLQLGEVQTQKGMVSTALSSGAYRSNQYMMEIVPKRGTIIGHKQTSEFGTHEQEFIMNHNSKLMLVGVKVVRDYANQPQLVYQMVEVDDVKPRRAEAEEPARARPQRRRVPARKPLKDMSFDELKKMSASAADKDMPKDVTPAPVKPEKMPPWLRNPKFYKDKAKREMTAKIREQLAAPVSKLDKEIQAKGFQDDNVQRKKMEAKEYESSSKRWDDWRSGLTKEEIKVFRKYSTNKGYESINGALRDPKASAARRKTAEANEEVLRKAMDKAPNPPPPQVVYRSVDANAGLHNLKIGDVQVQKGMVSTAMSSGAFVERDFMMEIVPKRGSLIGHKTTSSWGDSEQEFLMNHNSKLKLVGVKMVTNSVGKPQVTYQFIELD